MNKNDFKQIEFLRKEYKYLTEKLEKLNEKPVKIVQDSVATSSTEFPYTRHTTVIEGFENPKNIRKYKKMLRDSQRKLENKLKELEYYLKNVEDAEIRLILRLKYQENLSYIQIAHKMNEDFSKEYTADGIRMQINRFLDNLKIKIKKI